MNDRERLEMIDVVLDDLSDMCQDHVILIEGTKDRRALEKLLNEFECIMVQREGGPLKTAERLFESGKKAVILTDWDNKGEIIASDLSYHMKVLGVEFDTEIRRRLAHLCRKDIKDIESLDTFYNRLCTLL